MFRQGDVLLIPITSVPKTAHPVQREMGRLILARGEATGHHHSIVAENAVLLQAEAVAATRWLQVTGDAPVALEHQEHGTIMLPPGTFEIRIQREYSPEAIRPVAD